MKKKARFLGWVFSLILSACASMPQSAKDMQVTVTPGDGRIGTYVSTERGFATSSYWIEGPTGLILIDTQFLLSAGKEAVEWAEALTHKKVVLAIVLHPNPDKFNGTTELQKRGIRVVTSKQVLDLIPEIHRDRHYWFYKRFQPDYPDAVPLPESFGDRTTKLTAGGVTVTAHVLRGSGCSDAHVVVEFEKHVFVGDLVANRSHSWLELGKLDEWTERLQEIRALEPDFVHPGRGANGDADLLDQEENYLERVKTLMLSVKPKGLVNKARVEKVKEQLKREYPGYSYEYFLEIGLPAVWERLAVKR